MYKVWNKSYTSYDIETKSFIIKRKYISCMEHTHKSFPKIKGYTIGTKRVSPFKLRNNSKSEYKLGKLNLLHKGEG